MSMILIADSGSTKCDWMLMKGSQQLAECSSMGFNPYFHDTALIEAKIREKQELTDHAKEVEFVFFYGAGCSSPDLKDTVRKALSAIFPNAAIQVGHDLDAAGLATFSGVPHIACILGTGSNSCYHDGKQVFEEVPALAYILGDEGSGSFLGKRLLADYFYKRMPSGLAADFKFSYGIDMKVMVEKVYVQPHANVYLASLARFCSDHRDHPYILALVEEGLRKFLDIHVTCYPNYHQLPVDFVGSIAHYFEPQLRKVASEMGIQVGDIVRKPIQGLVDYHLQYTFAKTRQN